MSSLEAWNGFRSKFEYLVAENLVENGHCFDYEPKRIHYVSHHHYTPDFRVEGQDFYVECKGGSMSAEDRAKYQKASEQNEDLDLRFLFYNDRPIAKNSSTTFSMWAKRHGFPYSIGPEMPSQWMK